MISFWSIGSIFFKKWTYLRQNWYFSINLAIFSSDLKAIIFVFGA